MSFKRVFFSAACSLVTAAAFGVDNPGESLGVISESLELVSGLATSSASDIRANCDSAEKALKISGEMQGLDSSARKARDYAQRIYGIYCLGFPDETGQIVASRPIVDEEASGMPAELREKIDSTNTFWNTPPKCLDSDDMVACRYNHDSGKGVFVYKESSWDNYPLNYLVCAQNAAQGHKSFLIFSTSNYFIRSKCVVSSYPWVNGPGGRSDTNGVIDWPSRGNVESPVLMPRAMAQQCELAFRDAIYCTPSLIAFKTEHRDLVGVCKLETNRRNSRFLFIRVGNSKSRWSCELKDLATPDPEPRVLGYSESECNPDQFGLINLTCDLPYIPRSEYEHSAHFDVPRR